MRERQRERGRGDQISFGNHSRAVLPFLPIYFTLSGRKEQKVFRLVHSISLSGEQISLKKEFSSLKNNLASLKNNLASLVKILEILEERWLSSTVINYLMNNHQ